MECLARYKSPLVKGIKHVAFSNDGALVAASGMDPNHSLVVFSWKTTQEGSDNIDTTTNYTAKQEGPLASGQGPSTSIWSLGFSPDKSELIATCTRAVMFYTFENGVIKGTRGTGWKEHVGKEKGAKYKPPGAVTCHAFVEYHEMKTHFLYTGTHDGRIV
jgi:WD40 repeat protein